MFYYLKIILTFDLILFISVLFSLTFITGCQNFNVELKQKSNTQIATAANSEHSSVTTTSPISSLVPNTSSVATTSSAQATPLVPVKIGIVLGPGGFRSFSQIGLLQEFSKAKLPIAAVVGIEMGSLVGAIYSMKGRTFDVEWQMMKLKEDSFFKKSFLQTTSQDIFALESFLENIFLDSKIEDFKLIFGCPSYDLNNHQTQFISKGSTVFQIQKCIPYSPLFKSFNGNISAVTALNFSKDFLKAKGVNYFIYIDLLGDGSSSFLQNTDSLENILWNTIAQANQAQFFGFQKIISVPLSGIAINDFSQRRELIKRGQEVGKSSAREIQKELGM